MRSVGDWVAKYLDDNGMSYAQLGKKCGIGKTSIERIVNYNECSGDKYKKLKAILGEPPPDVNFEPESKGWAKNSNTPLMTALRVMEDTKRELELREEALIKVLQAVTPQKRAFMAVMTMTTPPSTFTERFDTIKKAMMAAHDRGLITLYLVPSKEKIAQLREECGWKEIASAESYAEGFARFQMEYRNILPEGKKHLADERMMLLPTKHLDGTAWLYIITLIGEAVSIGTVEYRIAERGPASKGIIEVVPWHSRHDLEMMVYIRMLLKRAFPNNDNEFAKEFLDRTRTD